MTVSFLWTDRCLLAVLLISFAITLLSLRKAHTRRALKQLFHKPLALSAGIVLCFFLIIGVLDSIHVRFNNQVDEASDEPSTLLEHVLNPLGFAYEKTYSAPLALRLYSTQTIMVDGKVKQIYPRLKYTAAFKTSAEKQQRILVVLVKSFLVSGFIVLLLWGSIISWRGMKHKRWYPLPTLGELMPLATFFVCIFFVFSSYWLSRDFHLFGTGKIGEDIFYYTVKSIRTGLVIGILTTLFMMPLALLLGITAGYFGGIIDDIIQYIYTTLSSIPGVLLITASVLSMQTYIANHPQQFTTLSENADARLLALCLILGVTSWTSLCRLLRAEALKLREIDFVSASKALGGSAFWIIRKHLLPNVMPIILITLVLDFSFLVLAEAVLSYVGVGVSPMTISWGNMINGARLELAREPIVWWPMLAAFLFMFTLVLASNLFADALRDVFDPRQT